MKIKKAMLHAFLIAVFAMLSFFTARGQEQYTTDDLLSCFQLVIEHPETQEVLETDFLQRYKVYVLPFRYPLNRAEPLRPLLEKIDPYDICQLDRRLYLGVNGDLNRPEITERNLTLQIHYNELDDSFLVEYFTEKIIGEQMTDIIIGRFVLAQYDEDWKIEKQSVRHTSYKKQANNYKEDTFSN